MIRKATRNLGFHPNEVVVIGNSDAEMGRGRERVPAPEIFIPAFVAHAAAQSRPASPPALAEAPTIN
jgi:hypothetical protein